MGIFSRFFSGKKSYESLKEFEGELTKFQKKSSRIMALIGTGGRLRGLPLVYSTEDEDILKKFAARLNEIIKPIQLLTESKKVEHLDLWFDENILLFKPITDDVAFFALLDKNGDLNSVKQWINKMAPSLENLFFEKDYEKD